MNLEQARFNMIEQQIRPWDVLDAHVLHLLSVVRREDFVPPAYRALAFVDMEIPLPSGQCMLAPGVEARMLQDLSVQKHETVLEIGAGSGHMAALLAHRAHSVLTLEIDAGLAAMARSNLQRAGVHNAKVRHMDGSKGWIAEAPFDVILLSGSVAEVPAALLAQLRTGGRLGAIVGEAPVMRATIVTRAGEAQFSSRQPWDTMAQRLLHFPEPSHFNF